MENNKSPERLIMYLMAAIWVLLFFYCTLSKPISIYAFLQFVVVQVTTFVVMNIFLVYTTLGKVTWRRRIFISGCLAVTLAASLTLLASWPPRLSELESATLLMLGIFNMTFIFALVLYVIGSLCQWQFGPSGVPAKKLSIKSLLCVTAALGLSLMFENARDPKPEQDILFFAAFFLPNIVSALCIAWIATRRRWRLVLPAVMLFSPLATSLLTYLLIPNPFWNPISIFIQVGLPDLIGSVILFWFYVASSRRGWTLHIARNSKVADPIEADFHKSQDPVGLFPEDANA